MKTFVFDVMLNGRFICTLKYKYCALFPLGSIPHVKKSPLYDQFEITKVLTAFGHKDKKYE